MNLIEEIAAAKSGVEYDFVSLRDIKECLGLFYQEYEKSGPSSQGLLAILEKNGYITSEQYSFLMEGIKEEGLSQNLNIKDRVMVEHFLGLRKDGNTTTRSHDGLLIVCTHCGAKFKIKQLPKAVSKFKCGKCQKYFIFTTKMAEKHNKGAQTVSTNATGLSQSTVEKIIAQRGGTISLDGDQFKKMANQGRKEKKEEPIKDIQLESPVASVPPKKKRVEVDIEKMFSEGAMFRGTKFETPMPKIKFDFEEDDDKKTAASVPPPTAVSQGVESKKNVSSGTSVGNLANEAALNFSSNFKSQTPAPKKATPKNQSVGNLANEAALNFSSNFKSQTPTPKKTIEKNIPSNEINTSDGISISGNDSPSPSQGGGINISGNDAFTQGGGISISENDSPSPSQGSGISISGNDAFTQGGGINISGDDAFSQGGGINISGDDVFSQGGGMNISGDDAFTQGGGMNISGNDAPSSSQGGGINISGDGAFTQGGGINISGDDAFTQGGGMNISGNDDFSQGGGISISGNDASSPSQGGGINISGNDDFSQGGGINISGDDAFSQGGGMNISGNDDFSQSGGISISGNNASSPSQGGGINISGNDDFSQGGGMNISGNNAFGQGGGMNISGDEEQEFSTDFLKMPELSTPQNLADAFDFNITKSDDGTSDTGTMELDANAVKMALAKKKQESSPSSVINQEIQESLKHAANLTLKESVFIIRHSMTFDFIDVDDAKDILDVYTRKSSDNLVIVLLQDGYITSFQYNSLLENLEKDKKAGRLEKVTLDTMESIQLFLGLKENKSVIKMSCPHCDTKYKVRVNLKGGKFKCGSCKNYFFLK